MELSNLIEIDSIMVVRSSFWGKSSNDMHGIYSLAPRAGKTDRIIHAQAYTGLTKEMHNPSIAVWYRKAPVLFTDPDHRADNTTICGWLLTQDAYGKDVKEVAKLIQGNYLKTIGV